MKSCFLRAATVTLSALLSAQSPLTTTYAGGSGLAGGNSMMWFDLAVHTQVTVTQLDLNLMNGSTASSIDLYTIAGGHAGHETTPAAWTLQASAAIGAPNPMGTATACAFAAPFTLQPGTYGIAIAYRAGLGQAYSNGPLGPYSTNELTLTAGGAGGIWGGLVYTPRVYNGAIHYLGAGGHATQSTYGAGCPARSQVAVYQQFSAQTFDLANSGLLFAPNQNGSYTVSPGTNLWFSGLANNLHLVDDSTVQVTLPFAFPHAGGSTAVVSPASNGLLWLGASSNSACCNGSSTLFLSEAMARIAPCWMDLDPSSGGGVFADRDAATGEFVITWSQVPEYGNTNVVDMQIALRQDGTFELRYRGVTNTSHVALTGYSMGAVANDPGGSDLSTVAGTPIVTAPLAAPLQLTASARPRLGTSINLTTSSIVGGSPLGISTLGFQQHNPGLDLNSLGAPGCMLFVQPLTESLFVVAGSSVALPLGIPSSAALAGMHVYSQSMTFTAGFNQLGVLFSNGLELGLDAQ